MSEYDGIILDLDGTLWNAAHVSAKGWNKAIKSQESLIPLITASDVESVSGHPFEECVKILFSDAPLENLTSFAQSLDSFERLLIEKEGGRLYDGVKHGVGEISKKCPLYIVSNCQDWYLDCFFEHSNLRPFFIDSDCFGKANIIKAEMIKNMVDKHKIENPVYIGDTVGDKNSSIIAQVDFGYVSYGFGDLKNEELEFQSFRELTKFFISP